MSALKVILAICLLTITGWVQGQSVPPELQGVYTGTATSATYESGRPLKMNHTVVLLINEFDWSMALTSQGSGSPETFTGPAAASSYYLFGKASNGSGTTIGGRLQVKGKSPLKLSLMGKWIVSYGDYWGVGDLTIKVKKTTL